MNGKTKTYILLAAVLAIWGIIGYRIFGAVSPNVTIEGPQNNIVAFVPKTDMTVDTFSIRPMERDPFLGHLYFKKKPKSNEAKTPVKKELVWPSILYHGMISKQRGKEALYIVSINGQQQILKTGQSIDGVTLRKANKTEVQVVFKGKRKTILKV
ncbi:hypothetical protein [Flavisericum labens]|uniref:hypothetical protein n=1 Tax=Flavisericum labens TaxID=3377112 RepID=UPI00387ACC46